MLFQGIPTALAGLARRCASLFDAVPERRAGLYELDEPELARVRLTAEMSADWLYRGDIARAPNPWRRGTREWVLWETSFQARVLQHECADTLPGPLPEGEDWDAEAVACLQGGD